MMRTHTLAITKKPCPICKGEPLDLELEYFQARTLELEREMAWLKQNSKEFYEAADKARRLVT